MQIKYTLHELTREESMTLFHTDKYEHDFCLVKSELNSEYPRALYCTNKIQGENGFYSQATIPIYHACTYGNTRQVEAYSFWQTYAEENNISLKKHDVLSLLRRNDNLELFYDAKEYRPEIHKSNALFNQSGYIKPIKKIQEDISVLITQAQKSNKHLRKMIKATKECQEQGIELEEEFDRE